MKYIVGQAQVGESNPSQMARQRSQAENSNRQTILCKHLGDHSKHCENTFKSVDLTLCTNINIDTRRPRNGMWAATEIEAVGSLKC